MKDLVYRGGRGLRFILLLLVLFGLFATRVAAQTSNADLVLSFSNSPVMVSLGQYFRVTINVFNSGPDPAANLVVTNVLPPNAVFVGAAVSQGTVTQFNGVVSCAFGTLPFYRSVALTIELKTTSLGSLTNLAAASCDTPDSALTNNAASWVTSVVRARFFGVGGTHSYYLSPTMTLLTNSQVLVAGQHLGHVSDLYSMPTRSFSLPAGTMVGVHEYGSATLLANGLVLLAGGGNATGAKTAEVYNPATQLFQQVGDMLVYSYGHYATLRPDGTVLLCGGALSTNELYNPVTQIFGLAPTLQCAFNGIYLPTGKYLYFGYGRAYLYDTNTSISVETSGFLQPRAYHTATLLANGKVLLAGGQGTWGATYDSLASAELYDPLTDTFTWTANLTARREYHSACLLPDGTVLLAGGMPSQSNPYSLTTAEVYDPNGATNVPGIIVSDASVLEGNSGTNYLNFKVSLTMTSALPVTVQYATADGTARSFTYGAGTPDYVAITGTVTFPPGSTNQVVPVPILSDLVLEPNETLYLNLSAPTQAWLARATATGTILDDDTLPTLTITPASVLEGDSGLSNAMFNVVLNAQSLTPVTVDYFTSDQTAHAGVDYVQTVGTLTFNPGDTSLPLPVPVAGNLIPEPDKTFLVTLNNPQNATIVGANAVGTILNDDGIAGRLHYFDVTAIPDPQTQTVGFPVTITARDYYGSVATNVPWPVRLSAVTTNVLATNLDFEMPSLAPWVPFDSTGLNHPAEQALFDVAGLGQPSTAYHTFAGGGTNGISQNIWLAGGIPYTFKVNLAVVNEFYDQACLGGAAYLQVGPTNAVAGLPGLCYGMARLSVSLVYTPPTNGIYPLTLTLTRDYWGGNAYSVYADDVQITYPAITPAAATNFTNGVWTGSVAALQAATNVALLANDGAGHKGTSNPFSIVAISDLGLSGSEFWVPSLRTGGQLTFNLTVTNRGPAAVSDAVVQTVLPANLTFLSASNSQGAVSNAVGVLRWVLGPLAKGAFATASLTTRADIPGAVSNWFSLSSGLLELNPADNGLALTNQIYPAVLHIDPASGTEAFASATGMVFNLSLSGGAAVPVSVDYYTIDLSAIAGVDYVATNGTVTFPPFATNASIRVYAIDNILDQPDRVFQVVMTNFVNVVPEYGTPTGGRVVDDDPPPVLSIFNTSVVEGDSGTTNAVFPLALSKPAVVDVTVYFNTSDGTATVTNNDYVATSSSVVFPAGVTNQTLVVPVRGNTVNEPDEIFFVNLYQVLNATVATNRAVCTILNDDAVPGRLDHFVFAPVPSPQYTNRPFALSLRAVDYLGDPASFAGSATLSAQTDQFFTLRLFDDFEDGDLGGWTNYSAPLLVSSNVFDTAAIGIRSLRLTGRAPLPAYYYGLRQRLTNSRPTGISFYVKAAQTNATCARLNAMGGAGYSAVDFYMNSKGLMGLAAGNFQPSIPYESNRWYQVDLNLNWTTRRVDCRVDGALLLTNVPFASDPYSGLDYIVLQNTDSATSWFDQLRVVELSQTNLLAFPSNLTGFVNGVWSNNVTVSLASSNSYFNVTDGNEHIGQSAYFDVLATGLQLSAPATLTEGAAPAAGQVSIPFALGQPIFVNLTSSLPARLTVTPTVTIPVGQTNAAFTLTVVDDSLLNGPQLVTVAAAATNLVTGTTVIEVDDNESAALSLVLPATAAENAGTLLNAGHLYSSAAPTRSLLVSLTSGDPASLTLPPFVTLAAGSTSAVFNVTLVDNQNIDGPRNVAVSASFANWTPATNLIVVTDNEDTNLRLAGPAQVSEGDPPARYTVSLSGTLPTNLTVALSSTDASRLNAPASVTIVAGETSAGFSATIVNDALYNGSETITVGASAPGFTSATTNVLLLDNEVHHFSFSAISSPRTSTVPFSVTVSARDVLGGPITAYNGSITLSGLGSGGTIIVQPTNVTLVAGQWTGNVTLFTAEPLITLRAVDTGGVSGQSATFTVVPPTLYLLNINAADVVYSPTSQRLWSLVGSNGTVIPTDPLLYQSEPAVPVGAGAAQLTTSGDGYYVHIANNGTNPWPQPQPGAGIYRFNTQTRSIDMMWTNQGYSVLDLKAMPGNSASVAVSWWEPGISPYERGVYLYDNGVARTNTGGGDSIDWSESGTRLYGNLVSLSPSDFSVMRVDASGLTTVRDFSPSFIGAHFISAGGLVFAGGGVADPERGIPLGGTGGGPVAGSSASGRFWQFLPNPGRITAFDLATLLPVGSMPLTGVSNAAGRLILWGTNGLAFLANSAQIGIARTSLIPAGPPADLALTAVTSGLPALVSNTFSCTLTVANPGPNNAANVVLAQKLPGNALLASVTPSGGAWTQSTSGLVCWLSNLTSGASATVTLNFVGTTPGLALLKASVTSDTTDPNRVNNLLSLPISVGRAAGPNTVTEIRQVTSDLAWNAAANRIFVSVPNAQVDLGNSLVTFDPLAGIFDSPIPTGTEPDKLAVAANGQYVYAGLDADSSIQRVNVSNRIADLKFPTGFGNVNDMAVLPNNPHAVVATVHTPVVVYDDGIQRSNIVGPTEYNQPYFLALASPSNCFSTYPTGFRRIAIDAGGATLLSDTRDTVVTYPDWEIKYGAGRMFTPGGRVFDPFAGTNIAVVPYSGLVAPDENDWRVFYLTGGGSTWTLSALDITNLQLVGSLTVTNVSGSPTRLIRWGIDGLAFRTTAGQLFLIRTVLADDRNNDGLPDAWQLQYFGSLNAPGSGPNDDPDGDGFTNLQENQAGLNPLIFDALRFTQAQWLPGSGLQLSVVGLPGTSYALQASSDLSHWTELFRFTCTNLPMVLTDPAATNLAWRFYRVAP